jgi:hypothetical protein
MPAYRHRIGKCAFLPDIAGLYSLITFVILILFDGGKALVDGDTLWHIAAGQHMLKSKTILTHDIFSHTAFGKSWLAHEWLSEVIMAWFHGHAGLIGTAVFFFLIAALSFWLLFQIVSRETDDWTAIFAVSVALTFSMTHMLARPHVFSWFFGVITLYALKKGERYYYLLPVVTALWANLHGGFILGLALQGLMISGKMLEGVFSKPRTVFSKLLVREKRPLVFLGLSILAAGINPFGYKLYLFPFQVTSKVFSTSIMEWLPPDLQQEWQFRLFFLGILFLVSLSRTRTTWTDRLFILFFFNAALTHQRNMGIAAVFLTPYLAKALKSLTLSDLRTIRKSTDAGELQTSPITGPLTTVILAGILILMAGPSHPAGRAILQTLISLPATNHPADAVAHLQKTRPSGKMFNKYSWGGYLIYELKASEKVFIDGRADMYGEKIFSDYQKIVSLDSEMENLLDEYDIGWVFYPTGSVLIRYLKMSGKWEENYTDEKATILVRKFSGPKISYIDKKH